MSQSLMPQTQPSFVYPDSVEVSKSNPNKRYFRVFLMNNSVTRPVSIDGLRWQVENIGVLDRDIDTFIGRPVIPLDKTKEGKHVDPIDKGIYQPRYKSKLDFIKDANAFYDEHGKAKIIDIYKPNRDVMIAAKTNENVILNYDAFCETEDPELIKILDENEKTDTKTYVSPGVVSIDSYYTDDYVKVIKSFVGTHTHIVDEPAFTEPVAYVHKRTCNIDGKTCYYDLLTASEEKTLNTNLREQHNMSGNQTPPSANDQVTLEKVVDDLNKAGEVSDQELSNIDIKTETKDATGKTISKETINTDDNKKQQKKQNNKKADEGEGNGEQKTEVEKVVKTENAEKVENETDAPLTLGKLQEILNNHTKNVLEAVEAKQSEKLEQTQKLQLVASFIPVNNEDLKTDHEFYNSLPVSKDQLKKILEDSKFNPNNNSRRGTQGKTNTDLAVGSTAKTVSTSKYNDSKTGRGNGSVEDDIHFLPDGDFIPSRYR